MSHDLGRTAEALCSAPSPLPFETVLLRGPSERIIITIYQKRSTILPFPPSQPEVEHIAQSRDLHHLLAFSHRLMLRILTSFRRCTRDFRGFGELFGYVLLLLRYAP